MAVLPAVNRPRQAVEAPSPQSSVSHQDKRTMDQLSALSRYSARLKNIHEPYRMGLGASVNRKGPSAHANMKDKADRATNEQVLDPRTRIILYKMIGRGLVQEINGCVSTGKEVLRYRLSRAAHAYTGLRPMCTMLLHLSEDILHSRSTRPLSWSSRTAIVMSRENIASAEVTGRPGQLTSMHNTQSTLSRHNPRKMVRVWAEKEMRNLKRLRTAGIPCPEPIEVRENVLVMTFVGDRDGW